MSRPGARFEWHPVLTLIGNSEFSASKGTERLQTLDRWKLFAAVSSLTVDHTNPRLAQLKPDWHSSFDGGIPLQIIYGDRRTIGIGIFCASECHFVPTFD